MLPIGDPHVLFPFLRPPPQVAAELERLPLHLAAFLSDAGPSGQTGPPGDGRRTAGESGQRDLVAVTL